MQADSLPSEPPGKPRFYKSKFYAFPFSIALGVEFFFYFSVLKKLQKLQAVAKIVQRDPMCSSPIFPVVRSYEIRVQYQNGNWRLVQCLCIVRTRDLFKKIGDIKGLFHARISKIKDRNKGPNRSRRD